MAYGVKKAYKKYAITLTDACPGDFFLDWSQPMSKSGDLFGAICGKDLGV